MSGGSSPAEPTKLRHLLDHVQTHRGAFFAPKPTFAQGPSLGEKNFFYWTPHPSPIYYFFLPLFFSNLTHISHFPISFITMGFTDFVSEAGLTSMSSFYPIASGQ